MKKIFSLLFFCLLFWNAQAQYGSLDAILTRLEEKRGINQHLENVNIDEKKFYLIKDFDDHTERKFIVLKGKQATYVEVFDDKKTGESSSNVFTGDYVRSKRNIISIRVDLLEGKKISIPITKTLLLTRQDKILYLIDINSKERWIDQASFGKDKK